MTADAATVCPRLPRRVVPIHRHNIALRPRNKRRLNALTFVVAVATLSAARRTRDTLQIVDMSPCQNPTRDRVAVNALTISHSAAVSKNGPVGACSWCWRCTISARSSPRVVRSRPSSTSCRYATIYSRRASLLRPVRCRGR